MKNVMKKVAVSSMLAVSLGAVSLLSPLATGQVMAKSGSDYEKQQLEDQIMREQQEAAQKAFEAKYFKTETTENAATVTPAQPATENNNQATTTKPVTTTNEAPATVNTIKVNVQEGETLASIAEKYGVTVEELVKINNLVKVGQELQVPQTKTNK
ncbi:LysM peptidoglycan-binding domain-containing protein [Paenibacillus polymyxa]|uniref:LysM peptidoglycan-binding domain-containing protein n=1 Tax=Paenibacillus polymyxa TaxID=1406 RepID=A0A8I1IPS9_PAEPO|nr:MULTISPECIES: LysM domain-containing protein [Paenibacillus]KAF6576013.1 LysM peptidoglycan-binding domain-containing protein [Paenibacillus sp. EKM206P]KAF6589647.1 LysM peptidoglycan-binding domain-containing protein [Paenibacillus sp. EKM205P]KEO78609.1 peptidoglycan-binding protein LysM [Paenibacillus polymyxa]MBM0633331.1 LysM peptidoglycan-binding domain-containing protein [Paenibacillus polymyxa]MCH6188117.1 LysM peptidoglycan-binding domain-containing protein [Paenibacillus polymyxa